MPGKRGKRDVITDHLEFLGFQTEGIQRRGVLTHLFIPPKIRRLPFQNAPAHLERLLKELRFTTVRNWRAAPKGPRSMRVVFRQPGETLTAFLRREKAGVRQQVALRAALSRPPPPAIDCLTNAFQVDPFVPRVHFAGYHSALDAYITVMDYAPGNPPSKRTRATGIAAIERALFTLWARGVALPDIPADGVRVSAAGAVVVDFTGARAPLKNRAVVQSSRNPLFPELWDSPRWLPGLVRQAAGLEAARQAVWLWSPACAGNQPARKNNNSLA